MHVRRMLMSGVLGVSALGAGLLAPAATFAATPATASPTPATCLDGHWPASVQGKPTGLHSGGRAGDYIWHDASGWHLRVTHASSTKFIFTGRIASSAALTVTPFRLEKGDTLTLSADKKTLTYKFYNYGHLDGIDFTTACAHRLAFGGSMAGHKLGVGRIWLGHRNRHPLENPFVVIRIR
jgi:ABC-type transport system substrate-binding protein